MYYKRNNLYVTPKGFEELKNQLRKLYRQRTAIGKQLHDAREPGRNDENTSYEVMLARSSEIENRAQYIRDTLRRVTLIRKPQHKDVVELGNMVELKNGKSRQQFMIVGSLEADPSSHKVSDQSPVGQQLLFKRIGDTVEIGNGTKQTYTITAIR